MIKKYSRIFIYLLKLKLSKEMIYSVNFLTTLFVDGTFFIIQMLAFSTIFLNTNAVNGWIIAVGVCIELTILRRFIWKRGLKRYSSASS